MSVETERLGVAEQTFEGPGPLSLVAEVTHRCPLHCVYCSNPLRMQPPSLELTTGDWSRVFQEALRLGVLHLHLTGGEPLARRDLVALIAAGREAGLYVNMVTSGIGLTLERLHALKDAGLEHIQLSLQDTDEEKANEFAGARVHAHKLRLAALIRQQNLAFTVNIVVHRQNLDRLDAMLALAESLEPQRIEIAHVQYYGWALRNRSRLMPTPVQVERSLRQITEAQSRLKGRIQLQAVFPDYYARYPKACVGGWGRQMILIDPVGRALPCHAAGLFLIWSSTRFGSVVLNGFGVMELLSIVFAVRTGWKNRAQIVNGKTSISEDVAVRLFSSPAMLRALILRAV